MPTLQSEGRADGPVVTGFSARGFRIDGEATSGGVLITPIWWRPLAGVTLDEATLAPLVEIKPEFVLLGTGATLRRPDRALVAALDALGVGVEPMDSRAAARAWGVLRAEDRWIAAALLPLA